MTNYNELLPYSESYWVIPGVFMAGEHPASYNENHTRKRIQGLIRAGIRLYIDLTTERDYSDILADEAAEYSCEVTYKNNPITDYSIPDQKQMIEILNQIDSGIAEKKSVYLHCHAGIGRTGMVVGCFLVRHGMAGGKALEEIQYLRRNVSNAFCRSPESDRQVDFVCNWKKDQ